MSRAPASMPQRALSLTEELERLEQSITLTLQEIDRNFSVAHRIVTTSILPTVDQYAAHSRAVWEGSKFWKQFFESSANVSLSGYEEAEQSSQLNSQQEDTMTEEETNTTATHTTLSMEDRSYETPNQQHMNTDSIQDLDLSNLTISPSHSTPRPQQNKRSKPPQFADYPSPYEALRAEVNNTTNLDATSFSQQQNPVTPGRSNPNMEDITHTPDSSPILPQHPPPQHQHPSSIRPSTSRKQADPIFHRVLDKTYRIQATPLTSTRYRSTRDTKATTTTTPGTTTRNPLLDSVLSSSPEVAPPQLHAEIFSSPERRRISPTKKTSNLPRQTIPGVSVLTPARKKRNSTTHATTGATATVAAGTKLPPRTTSIWDDSDDSDDTFLINEATGLPFGASPPKTMQFHIPQSRLLKTPAKEASRLIVADVLTAAGLSRPGLTSSLSPTNNNNNNHSSSSDDDFDLDLDTANYGKYSTKDVRGDDEEYEMDYEGYEGYDDDENDREGGGGGGGGGGGKGGDPTSPSIIRKAVGLEDETF